MDEIIRFLMINLKKSESDFNFENDINNLLEQTKLKYMFGCNEQQSRDYSCFIR